MQAYIFGLGIPLIPLLLRRLYKKEEHLGGREFFLRYVINTLVMTAIATFVMVFLCDDNTSFLEKVDSSPMFAIKFLAVEILAAAIVTAAEWIHETGKVTFVLDRSSFRITPILRVYRRLCPFLPYFFAAVLIYMNVLMIFDNVLWGDEAFSANLVRQDFGGIMQVLTQLENHPPLYYYWLKLWVMAFGASGPVYHFASVVVFMIGAVLAVTVVKKHYGRLPAAFFLVISGLSASCLVYNVEVRMYALAFLGVAYCYYCCARLLENNRPVNWAGMVLWGAVAAYSHYYALLSVTILMITTCLFAVKRFGKKTWVRVFAAGGAFLLIYLPWLSILFSTLNKVTHNWWESANATPADCMHMVFGGENMSRLSFPLWLILFVVILGADFIACSKARENGRVTIEFRAPGWQKLSPEAYALIAGTVTIVLTVIVGLLSAEFTELVLVVRFIYPLTGVVAVMLVIVVSRALGMLKKTESIVKGRWPEKAGACILSGILLLMIYTGYGDYRAFTAENQYQSQKTQELLQIIGEPEDGMVLVNNGIQHIGWTVLEYYFPEAEILNGRWDCTDADHFWYFTPDVLDADEIAEIEASGLHVIGGYAYQQLVKYPLTLYDLVRE